MWIADTGATRHVACSKRGMYNIRAADDSLQLVVASGESVKPEGVGEFRGCVLNNRGKR